MASLKHTVKTGLNRLGVDLRRYPESDPAHQTATLLRHHSINLVLDVGANDGGYALGLRRHGYTGRILSFEPLSSAFSRLAEYSGSDPTWKCLQVALGPEQSRLPINVAGNSGASSSFLNMLALHNAAAPNAAYVGTEEVDVERLDDIIADESLDLSRIHLKLDVQGFEEQVLAGARGLLNSPKLVGLQLELSLAPLYEGALSWQEAAEIAAAHQFELFALQPGFVDKRTGRLLQADGIYFRTA